MRKLPFEQDGYSHAHLCPELNIQHVNVVTVIVVI